MLLIATVLAPLIMLLAASVERRLGPAVGGWITALPLGFAVTLVAMALTAGPATAGSVAASAAGHVSAQVVFGLLFGAALARWGLLAGGVAGTLGYLAACVALDLLPQDAALFLGLTALAGGTRLVTPEHPRASRPRRPSATVLVCLSAAAVVLGSTLASRAGGPVVGGAAAAFPTMSGTLAVAVTAQAGRREGADVLTGLVRSLPCFSAFAFTIAICARHLGLWSFAIAAITAVTVAALTWHYTNTPKRTSTGRTPRQGRSLKRTRMADTYPASTSGDTPIAQPRPGRRGSRQGA
ncbi:MAG TPA: hypothetical protein VEF71_20450 [Streptosporangiaceae bacterium]|nr:hypothetical protein [Streptosporangiaceae bacterium]